VIAHGTHLPAFILCAVRIRTLKCFTTTGLSHCILLLAQVAEFLHRHFAVDRDGETHILVYSTSSVETHK